MLYNLQTFIKTIGENLSKEEREIIIKGMEQEINELKNTKPDFLTIVGKKGTAITNDRMVNLIAILQYGLTHENVISVIPAIIAYIQQDTTYLDLLNIEGGNENVQTENSTGHRNAKRGRRNNHGVG